MILKARQFGVSTGEIIRQFDHCIFNKNVNCAIIADEQRSIEKLFTKVRYAYDNLHHDLRPPLAKGGGSKFEFYFPSINSRIFCGLEFHGVTINWLHVSEAALMKDKSRLDSTLQAVPKDGKVTLETTPKGMNWFYDEWVDQNSTFKHHFFPWFIHDEYFLDQVVSDITDEEKELMIKAKKTFGVDMTNQQIAWRRFKKNELKDKFLEQYPEDDITCFLSSGQCVFNLEKIKSLLDNLKAPLTVKDNFKVFVPHQKNLSYVGGADTSEGIGQDRSVFTLFCVETREQVAVLSGQFHPYDFAHKINELCKKYTHANKPPPLVAVERNNHGHAVLLELQEHIKYSNLFKTKDGKTGWLTDRVTRPIMINAFIDGVENESVKINDADTLGECLTFVNKDGKIEAEDGKHDDRVIASCIAVQLLSRTHLEVYNNLGSKILV